MTMHVALLRAVNLGSKGKVSMADLRVLMEDLGLKEGKTLINSGNLVFRSEGKSASDLEELLEKETEKRLGLKTDYFVRTAAQWQEAIAANPFPAEAKSDPAHLVVMVLKAAPRAGAVEALQAAITGRETVRAAGRQAYFVYPDGIGTSKLTINVIEKHLGVRGTARNWNTVQKLAALAGDAS